MVEEGSIQIALDYIKKSGRLVASSELVSYMDSKDVPYKLRTTEMTTRYKIIPELKKRHVVKVGRYRHGKKQFLSFNHKNRFDALLEWILEINEQFSKLPDPTKIKSKSHLEVIKSYDEVWAPNVQNYEKHLKIVLFEVDAQLHNTTSAKILNDKILKLWKDLSLKDTKVQGTIKLYKQYVGSKK